MASDQPASEPLRVMFVTRKWPPAMGGMETYCVRLTEELAELCELDVVALPGRQDGSPPSPFALLMFPFSVIARWFKRDRVPDVLHLGDMAIWPIGLLAWLAFGRTTVALSAHGTDVSYHRRGGLRGTLYGWYMRLGSRLLHRAKVIANSRATRDVAAETGWRDAAIVPLGTDMRPQEIDGTHNGRILFAGRLVERKGCAWFVENVLPELPDEIGLDIAGTVWRAEEASVFDNPRVRFLGALEPDNLAAAYASALCVILPNIPVASGEYEGFGLVAPEAAAAGGVVIASACDGLLDAVIDGETGFLVQPGDAGAWGRQIVEIAGWSIAERRAFISNSASAARKNYDWSLVASKTIAAIRAS